MFSPGDDVWVEFDDNEWPGVVQKFEDGWVRATIQVDPEWDFGSLSDRMSVQQTVLVRVGSVRERLREDSQTVPLAPESGAVQ